MLLPRERILIGSDSGLDVIVFERSINWLVRRRVLSTELEFLHRFRIGRGLVNTLIAAAPPYLRFPGDGTAAFRTRLLFPFEGRYVRRVRRLDSVPLLRNVDRVLLIYAVLRR